jgi:hypothetical protein
MTYSDIAQRARASRTQNEWCDREILFETIEEHVRPDVTEVSEEILDDIIHELLEFIAPHEGETAPHYAVRMLVHQAAWQKGNEAFEATLTKIESGEAS